MRSDNSISGFHYLIIFILLLSFTVTNNYSQLAGFRGEMPVWIKNNSGQALTNFPVKLKVNTQYLITLGLLNATGRDMRFGNDCSGATLYNYRLDNYLNTDSTAIYVKIPSIPANDSVLIYMFFGSATDTSQSTYNVFNGPHSSTDSVATGGAGGVANSQRGFRFTPIVNILVTHFGKREPTGTTRYVTLFDFTSQQVLRQKQVSGPAAQYYYDTLGSPIWLLSGHQYVIELFQGNGDGYYFGTSSQIGQHLTYGDMRYCNSCTQNTFPTSILTNYHYGYPDFWYYVVDTVSPAPTNRDLAPADTNTPAPPQNLDAAQGNQSAFISWRANTEFDIAYYLLYRNTVNNPLTATRIDSSSYTDTTYADSNLVNETKYFYWVKAGDRFCTSRLSNFSAPDSVIPNPIGIVNNGNNIPKVFALHQNYPNPFNPVTYIGFDLPKATLVQITIYDLLGREVDVIVNQFMTAGRYKADWDATNFASGVYFYKIEAGSFVDRKKMIVLK